MAKIDYSALALGIKGILDTQLSTQTPLPKVVVEKEFVPNERWIGIYCQSRAPDNGQALALASRQRQIVQYMVRVWAYAMSLPESIRLRDGLLSRTEVALMTDQTMGGNCVASWMEGGRFISAQDNMKKNMWFGGAEIILKCDCVAKAIA